MNGHIFGIQKLDKIEEWKGVITGSYCRSPSHKQNFKGKVDKYEIEEGI